MWSITIASALFYLGIVPLVSLPWLSLAGQEAGSAEAIQWDLGIEDADSVVLVTALLVLIATINVAVVASSLGPSRDGDKTGGELGEERYLWAEAMSVLGRVSSAIAVSAAISRWQSPGLLIVCGAAALLGVWLAALTRLRDDDAVPVRLRAITLAEQETKFDERARRLARRAKRPVKCPEQGPAHWLGWRVLGFAFVLAIVLWPIPLAADAIEHVGEPRVLVDAELALSQWAVMFIILVMPAAAAAWSLTAIVKRDYGSYPIVLGMVLIWGSALGVTIWAFAQLRDLAAFGATLVAFPLLVGVLLSVNGMRGRGPYAWILLREEQSLCRERQDLRERIAKNSSQLAKLDAA